MTGRFRGFALVKEEFQPVEGTGVFFIDHKAYIIKSTVPTIGASSKVQVVPVSVSPSAYVQDLGHVFVGDVVKYTFKEKQDYFNIYYQVVEHGNVMKFMELYRDYVLDADLQVVRGRFKINRGKYRALDTSMKYDQTYTVVGNIWQNPEFER